MAADVASALKDWSTTAASNLPAGSTAISTNLDDNLREIQAVVRDLASPNTVASATTTDIGAVNETFLTISGTTTITGLGTVSAGIYKWLIFSGALTLTHNGTSLILPSAANITTAAGDSALMLSLGSGNWRCLYYSRSAGTPLISATLSGLIAAAAANTIANADYAQVWQWALTTAGKQGFSLSESAASTGSDAILFDVGTVAASTAWPMRIRARGTEVFVIDEAGAQFLSAADGSELRLGYRSSGSAPSTSSTPGAVRVIAQGSTDSTAGGGVFVTGGASTSGVGGAVTITGGSNDSGAAGGAVAIAGGAGATSGDITLGGANIQATASGGFWLMGTPLKVYQVTPPTISAGGGSGGAITGSDTAFQVTFGSGSPTTVTVDFNVAYGSAPMVLVSGTQSGQIVHVASVSTTQVQIASSTAFSSGTKVNVLCIEQGA